MSAEKTLNPAAQPSLALSLDESVASDVGTTEEGAAFTPVIGTVLAAAALQQATPVRAPAGGQLATALPPRDMDPVGSDDSEVDSPVEAGQDRTRPEQKIAGEPSPESKLQAEETKMEPVMEAADHEAGGELGHPPRNASSPTDSLNLLAKLQEKFKQAKLSPASTPERPKKEARDSSPADEELQDKLQVRAMDGANLAARWSSGGGVTKHARELLARVKTRERR
jgi:hypothetical protein